MTDPTLPIDGPATGILPSGAINVVPEQKGIDLAVIKRGAKDYLEFVDDTKETFFAYLYHRTGSLKLSQTLLGEVYISVLGHAMSLWWFGALGLKLLLDAADKIIAEHGAEEADIDHVYIPTLTWLQPEERTAVSSFHDVLWSLPKGGQRLIVLSLLIGLTEERIGQALGVPQESLKQDLATAKDMLITRWQPPPSVIGKLQSMVFVPGLDIAGETSLRFSIVEKYNAVRFRRYQWVILGGLFAVLSNVIVASVLAFVVIVQPPTSLRSTRAQVASLDALVLSRDMEVAATRQSLKDSLLESQKIAAYDVSRSLTAVGLGTALEALKAEQSNEKQVDKVIELLKRAQTAMQPILEIAWQSVPAMVAIGSVL